MAFFFQLLDNEPSGRRCWRLRERIEEFFLYNEAERYMRDIRGSLQKNRGEEKTFRRQKDFSRERKKQKQRRRVVLFGSG